MPPAKKVNRRQFLKKVTGIAAGAIAFPYVVPSSALGKADTTAASERVVMGCIGMGPRGLYDMRELMAHGAQVVAVCDVRADMLAKAKQRVDETNARRLGRAGYKGCDTTKDFREVAARSDIDAVLVATPDRWHVPNGIAAVKAGKDLYLEKPMGITIAEGKAMREAVKQNGVVFMHGTEMRTNSLYRHMCELVRNKYIGDVHTVTLATPKGGASRNYPPTPVPAGFDYDMWLGPAPRKLHCEARCRGGSGWVCISDYQPAGMMAGWAIHALDLLQWGLGTEDTGPVEIEGTGEFPKSGLNDTAMHWNIEFRYANGVTVKFKDHSKVNEMDFRFIGTDGWVEANYYLVRRIHSNPPSLVRAVIGPDEIHLPYSNNDNRNFIECVRSRTEPVSPFEAAHRSVTVCYLCDIAVRLGRKLRWDPVPEHFIDDAEAERMLSRPMRSPWHL